VNTGEREQEERPFQVKVCRGGVLPTLPSLSQMAVGYEFIPRAPLTDTTSSPVLVLLVVRSLAVHSCSKVAPSRIVSHRSLQVFHLLARILKGRPSSNGPLSESYMVNT
jgi:hypothetical protein